MLVDTDDLLFDSCQPRKFRSILVPDANGDRNYLLANCPEVTLKPYIPSHLPSQRYLFVFLNLCYFFVVSQYNLLALSPISAAPLVGTLLHTPGICYRHLHIRLWSLSFLVYVEISSDNVIVFDSWCQGSSLNYAMLATSNFIAVANKHLNIFLFTLR